jgi:hypothetical protein
MKNIVIYLQDIEGIDKIIYEMKKHIYMNGWKLIFGYVDRNGEAEQLEVMMGNLQRIDSILIFNRCNIKDAFNLELLLQTAQLENTNIVEFKKC